MKKITVILIVYFCSIILCAVLIVTCAYQFTAQKQSTQPKTEKPSNSSVRKSITPNQDQQSNKTRVALENLLKLPEPFKYPPKSSTDLDNSISADTSIAKSGIPGTTTIEFDVSKSSPNIVVATETPKPSVTIIEIPKRDDSYHKKLEEYQKLESEMHTTTPQFELRKHNALTRLSLKPQIKKEIEEQENSFQNSPENIPNSPSYINTDLTETSNKIMTNSDALNLIKTEALVLDVTTVQTNDILSELSKVFETTLEKFIHSASNIRKDQDIEILKTPLAQHKAITSDRPLKHAKDRPFISQKITRKSEMQKKNDMQKYHFKYILYYYYSYYNIDGYSEKEQFEPFGVKKKLEKQNY